MNARRGSRGQHRNRRSLHGIATGWRCVCAPVEPPAGTGHRESTRLQYALVERAAGLGWARSRIVVIDEDLGRSAAVAGTRPGFARLVTEVTMGRVGTVVGIEMSRLARTGRDRHQLLELCSLSGALLADPDGVYDPGYYNDRLLLGLKGTMSEAVGRLDPNRRRRGGYRPPVCA
jgi:DNA invertase Pin-like site-specific DNA recombinase